MSIEKIYERFGFIFKNFPFDSFLKFAVIRDPLEWVISWYNFRSRPSLKRSQLQNKSAYAGNLSFNEFWESNKGEFFLLPQTNRFFSPTQPHVKVNYIINQRTFLEDFEVVKEVLDLGSVKIPKKNRSLSRITSTEVDTSVKQDIQSFYQADYELIESLASFNDEGIKSFRSASKSNKSEHRAQRSPEEILSVIRYRLGVILQRS
ncbi:MAG: sulfotransferase family 2 domain-containing protein [Cyanobacteria bacterium J06648_16]